MADKKNIEGFEWDDLFTGAEPERAPSGFVHLEPGVYTFTVGEIEKSQSRTGKPMLKAELIFEGDAGKTKVFYNTTIREQLISFLMSIGYLRNGETKPFNAADLLDRQGVAAIKDSERKRDNGEPYSEVHYFVLPDDAEMEW